ncbi:cell division protein ZapE [Sedimenticola sp.]|uniref:cell division protein ZapE n=1 Tax=Sedimenticola sp. TaxID=1940285 RepID=UPI00258AD501|nr:cell division protein ZapE [Sedimenticola sp.]MCW8904147.1 cell division protein ZapE [Sedimenticola sp.]
MTPEQFYQHQLQQNAVVADPDQAAVVAELQALYKRLIQPAPPPPEPDLLSRLLKRTPQREINPATGLYLWGGVGRGKTWLVDLFFNQLPFDNKLRIHFHHFMRNTHESLSRLKGVKNPLDRVAESLAARTRILCLDEFIVTDIGDAMILAQLLKSLFSRGVTLVTTSNTEPDNLYRNGLQRASFLPAIELIKQHTRVIHLDSTTDYRLRYLQQATVYHTPLGAAVNKRLIEEFEQLAPEPGQSGGTISLYGREIPVQRLADDLIWFDFFAICGPPRSQADYLELARCYHTVIISDIPLLTGELDDAARRFVFLVDEFYDRGVKLIISAAAGPLDLYRGERLKAEFERAVSRLQEMQSIEYLSREHRA